MNELLDLPTPTLIAEGSTLRGEVTLQSGARVSGTIEGNLHHRSTDVLLVGANGWLSGKIVALGPVYVEGRVQGTIQSDTLIRLLPTARVHAKLEAPRIEICAGAEFVGETRMEVATEAEKIPMGKAA